MNLVRGGAYEPRTRRHTWRHTCERGAQWLVTLCASVVHEWDKCATILAFEVYLVTLFSAITRGSVGPFLAMFASFMGVFGILGGTPVTFLAIFGPFL